MAIVFGSRVIGEFPGLGEADAQEMRQSMITAAALGIAAVCVLALVALRRTPKPRRVTMWLAPIPGTLLVIEGVRIGQGYTGNERTSVWMFLAAAVVTLVLTRLRKGASRVWVACVAVAAVAVLAAWILNPPTH